LLLTLDFRFLFLFYDVLFLPFVLILFALISHRTHPYSQCPGPSIPGGAESTPGTYASRVFPIPAGKATPVNFTLYIFSPLFVNDDHRDDPDPFRHDPAYELAGCSTCAGQGKCETDALARDAFPDEEKREKGKKGCPCGIVDHAKGDERGKGSVLADAPGSPVAHTTHMQAAVCPEGYCLTLFCLALQPGDSPVTVCEGDLLS